MFDHIIIYIYMCICICTCVRVCVCVYVCIYVYESKWMRMYTQMHTQIHLSLSLSHLQRTYLRVCASILYAELSHLIANQTLNTSEFVSQPCQLVLCGTADV